MTNLQLPLKTKWFEMTDPDGKTEDYREITTYWVKRLTEYDKYDHQGFDLTEAVEFLRNNKQHNFRLNHTWLPNFCFFKPFTTNIMTLGYPKSTDTSRIKVFEHAGIEIRTGNPEWGAEPNKLYFVIKHGKKIT